MNGRLYDPVMGRMFSADVNIIGANNLQGYNRYSYALNNPLSYVPDGNTPIIAAAIIGAAAGAYMGGTMANGGQYNRIKWDFNSGKTWGWTLGGAIVGGVSGGLGAYIAGGGGIMANTMGIMTSSYINSMGTFFYTGGQTYISMSYGNSSNVNIDLWLEQ